jgi:hypothetical protein
MEYLQFLLPYYIIGIIGIQEQFYFSVLFFESGNSFITGRMELGLAILEEKTDNIRE